MAKKQEGSALAAEVKKAIGPKKAVKKAPAAPSRALEQRVAELEGDLVRIVESIGGIMGEPFKAIGREIVTRHQGPAAQPPKE